LSRQLIVPVVAVMLGIFAIAAYVIRSDQPAPLPIVAPPLSAIQQPMREDMGQGWRVVNTTSAHRMMVVEVETHRVNEAVAIAQQVVNPVRDRYDEILVFFFEPDASPRRASLRIQWTPRGGYRRLQLR
jgi:hypothetical protein